MLTAARIVRVLCLALWVGGIVFFAFAVAPVAFSVLPTRHEAGMVVAASLNLLHWMGLGCGVVYVLVTAALLVRRSGGRAASILLVSGMLLLTALSQFAVVPSMERDRIAAGGAIDDAAPDSRVHLHFDRLHHVSERMEGGVLLLGLVALALLASEPAAERTTGR